MCPSKKEPWYMQTPPGCIEYVPGINFLFVEEKNPNPTKRTGAVNYTNLVKDHFWDWREKGWEGWLAAENQNDHAGATKFWIWLFGKTEKYLEWVWCENSSSEVETLLKLHRGMAWRFPIICFFTEFPAESVMRVLEKYKTPYSVNPVFTDVGEEPEVPELPPVLPPPIQIRWDEANEIPKWKMRLEAKLDLLAEHILGVV